MKTLSKRISRTGWKRLPFFLWVAVLAGVFLPGCLFHRHRRADLATAINPGDQPDKILYEKATNEIAHGRYDVGRLTLQTLINTYPDSEYLAKAKLAIADSYYEQGGVSGFTQSEAEYRDFITFFPTAPEAPEAQYRIGMAHFRLMAKADRDQTEARPCGSRAQGVSVEIPRKPLGHPRQGAPSRNTRSPGAGGVRDREFLPDEGRISRRTGALPGDCREVPQLQPRGRGPVWNGSNLGAPENPQGSGSLLLAFGS